MGLDPGVAMTGEGFLRARNLQNFSATGSK